MHFIGGHELFSMFRKYWPDFIADEASATERYLHRMSEHLKKQDALPKLATIYDFFPVEGESTKIYVKPSFHRDLQIFAEKKPLLDLVPEPELLGAWERQHINGTVKSVRLLKRTVEHFREWGYCRTAEPDKGDTDTLVLIENFISAFLMAWEHGKVKVKQGKARKLCPRELHDVQNLVKLARHLKDRLIADFGPLKDAQSRLRDFIESKPTGHVSLLSDKRFLSACALDESLGIAPSGLFSGKKAMRVNFAKDLLLHLKGSVLVVGDPGSGKTSFCRWNALADAERFNLGESDILPVYIPLSRFTKEEIASFDETFLSELGKSALLDEETQKKWRTSAARVRLYLDGLDEIADGERRKRVVKLAHSGSQERQHIQILVTSRDYVHGPWLTWLPRISLSSLDDHEVRNLAEQWFQNDNGALQKFFEQLAGVPALNSLIKNPLLATLIILVFKQTRQLPANKVRLYSAFIDLLSGGWDLAKGILRISRYGRDIKMMVLAMLAGQVHCRRQKEFERDELEDVARRSLSRELTTRIPDLEEELIRDGVIRRNGHLLMFSHFSFQEFLAAKDLAGDQIPKRVLKLLRGFLLGDDWWKEALYFYVGLSSNPRGLTIWLMREIDRMNIIGPVEDESLIRARADDLLYSLKEAFPSFGLEELVGSIERRRGDKSD